MQKVYKIIDELLYQNIDIIKCLSILFDSFENDYNIYFYTIKKIYDITSCDDDEIMNCKNCNRYMCKRRIFDNTCIVCLYKNHQTQIVKSIKNELINSIENNDLLYCEELEKMYVEWMDDIKDKFIYKNYNSNIPFSIYQNINFIFKYKSDIPYDILVNYIFLFNKLKEFNPTYISNYIIDKLLEFCVSLI
jgi:hypothetical protein